MTSKVIFFSLIAMVVGQDKCLDKPDSVCVAGGNARNDDEVSMLQTQFTVSGNGWKTKHKHSTSGKVPPPSVTLQCILNLSMQYFIVYTMLQILRTVNQFSGGKLFGWQKVLETACTTVTYAPSICCLFLGCRLRAVQLGQGDPDKYKLPQDWAKNAMYCCAYAILVQVLLVCIVPLFTGETSCKTDSDGNLDLSSMEGGGIAVMVLSAIRYLVMLALYGGFVTVCVGIYLMEGPKELWGTEAPPVSPAVACTVNLCTQFFAVYLLVALVKTAIEINGASPFLVKLQGVLSLAKYTVNYVPMLSILFIGARMRALSMDPVNGNPQWWAQYCFYGCSFSVLVQTLLVIVLPFCTKCECKLGMVEGDVMFIMQSKIVALVMTVFRYIALLALYGGFTAVCVSVYIIENPIKGEVTPPISPAMQCVMNLTVQYFFVYLMLFLLITIKQFSGTVPPIVDTLIYTFEGAQKTIMFAPMLAILFMGCRLRALQLILGANAEAKKIPPGAGPQTWAQDAMFLATWSLHVQLIMTILVALILGGKPEMDSEDGGVKAPAGSSNVVAIIFDVIRYLCLLSMYGGSVTIMVAIYYMKPEDLPPNDAGGLIPTLPGGIKIDIPSPPTVPPPKF